MLRFGERSLALSLAQKSGRGRGRRALRKSASRIKQPLKATTDMHAATRESVTHSGMPSRALCTVVAVDILVGQRRILPCFALRRKLRRKLRLLVLLDLAVFPQLQVSSDFFEDSRPHAFRQRRDHIEGGPNDELDKAHLVAREFLRPAVAERGDRQTQRTLQVALVMKLLLEEGRPPVCQRRILPHVADVGSMQQHTLQRG
mmetsp:Transcript_82456/g.237015  ORF Transcript_82456/g.237015 Transcript_82456/m.237015 type:complete len:202 (+) Transcript_82456:20-625(+)